MLKKLILLIFICLNLYSNENVLDSITLSKIKKTVEMEEELATAYKKYILDKGTVPTLANLKDNGYLESGFSSTNPFGMTISISTTNDYSITNGIPDSIKANIYDYYYSTKYRNNTKEPLKLTSDQIKIKLNTKEKFIFDNKSIITTNTTGVVSKYSLQNGVLHWYNSSGTYQYSYNNDLIVAKSIQMTDSDGLYTTAFKDLTSNVRYAGQTILQESDEGVVEDYISTNTGLIKLDADTNDVGKTIIQFTRRAGGMIVNGDIYTWGNNGNRITGIDSDTYTKEDGTSGNRYPVINTLVRAKVKTAYAYSDQYFSSPLRPKFNDFFSTVYHSTCGIDTTGALYCGGTKGNDTSYGNIYNQTDTVRNGEMLYKSTFFDGVTNKAKKIFANNQIWHILSKEGYIYIWGHDYVNNLGSGFSGNGQKTYNSTKVILPPEKLELGTTFQDINYLLTIDYRKIGALSTTGDIYIWGIESGISNGNCTETWENVTFNLCLPTKITSTNSTLYTNKTGLTLDNITFESFKGGLQSFVAKDTQGNYYKIYQPKSKKIQVYDVDYLIGNENEEIISVDISSSLTNGENNGIVWVNSNKQLKGDYSTTENDSDPVFKNSINAISWKQIKVIQDGNGMCGIDIYNQMYCWGMISFFRTGTTNMDKTGNTFMIPIFNTNLYDSTKDYMLAEGGSNGYLTDMTSIPWDAASNSSAFFMKYPTYIGGFNYEYEFK